MKDDLLEVVKAILVEDPLNLKCRFQLLNRMLTVGLNDTEEPL
jgi:hypothetical protein